MVAGAFPDLLTRAMALDILEVTLSFKPVDVPASVGFFVFIFKAADLYTE